MESLSEKVVFLIGGQGSQYFGMARVLLENDAVFRSTMLQLDRLAVQRSGRSVLGYIYDPAHGVGDRCDDLVMTNLGLFFVEYSLARTLDARGIQPDLLVGSSLGEFIAIAVAGQLPPQEVLDFIWEMSTCVVRTMVPGGMVAVLASLDEFQEAVRPRADVDIASVNSAQHFVISGERAALDRACRMMAKRGLIFQDLPVDFAFHSHGVDAARADLGELPSQLKLAPLADVPGIYSCSSAALVTEVSAETCWRVIRQPIRLTETVRGIPDYRSYRYVDLTPSSSLAAALRSSLPEITSFPIITRFNAEPRSMERLAESLGAKV